MKIYIEHLLKVCGSPKIEVEQLAEQLTMTGLEVELISPSLPKLDNIVVGEILSAEKHPNADKLQVCKVNVGYAEPLNIVCGAQNARVGLRVVVALEGAVLPNGMEIKKAKLRGIESCGMLCSAKEIGLAKESLGIIELQKEFQDQDELPSIGKEVYPYIKDKNRYIELNITPNRGDCLSVLGIAREIAAINKIPKDKIIVFPNVISKNYSNSLKKHFPIEVNVTSSCPHYVGKIIRNINPNKPTPEYIKNALILNGINPISLLVDITNYVMLECGQPMHAFDLDKISKGIVVRYAHKGEKIALLDGKEYELTQANTLVIADHEKPLALAGVMGGSETSVTDKTHNILLESAFFFPEKISITSQYYGIVTDSSSRFVRGVDFELQNKAVDFAMALLSECASFEEEPAIEIKSEENLPSKVFINLRKARIERILGISVADEDVVDILQRLNINVSEISDGWKALAPSYRFDINQEIDLIEELVRIYGYNKIPNKKPSAELAIDNTKNIKSNFENLPIKRIKSLLVDRGYQEIMTYSFIDSKLQNMFSPNTQPIELKNPISQEMAVMRTSLWPGLISSLLYNQNHQQTRMRLFEIGMCFKKDNKLIQEYFVSGLIVGENYPLQWGESKRYVDFFDIKNDVEALLSLTNNTFLFTSLEDNDKDKVLHPYKSATICLIKDNNKINIGCLGVLHPKIKQALKIKQDVYLFEIEMRQLINALIPIFKPISKFPSVFRDIAIVVDEKVSAQEIRENIFATVQKFSEQTGIYFEKNIYQSDNDVVIFDAYQGAHIEKGKKSLALKIFFQHFSRTLLDEEINNLVELIINSLNKKFQAILRS